MIIRHATTDDLDSVTLIETSSFNEKEAAKKEEIEERIRLDGSYFWLLDDNGEIIAFVQGFPTEAENLTDDMFHTAQKFNTNGGWLMLLSVAAHPLHRGKGFASMVMRRVISDSREQCRKGIVLTCKEQLIPFYQKFGFQNEGRSGSEHGGAIWYQMRLTF
ncbi:MAG: GNAT family N-acetyltransferase [Ruminococcus sp.]|nr:GNAT family N-acetyltransferase [Ruminococcus sp.]